MGFSSLLDILGSTLIGGMLLMILLRMNDAAVQNTFIRTGDLIVQQNLTSIVELLEFDLRKIGYCENWESLPDPTRAILSADSNSITFLTDVAIDSSHLTGDGIVDTLKYWLGPVNEARVAGTPNPRDRILYRQVNNDPPLSSNLGVTQFSLKYFNALGNEITSMPSQPPLGIITMQIDITVENPAAYGNENSEDVYSEDRAAFWRQIRLAAPSLRNR